MAKSRAPMSEGSSRHTHPFYAEFAEAWGQARDIYEGTGGFLDEERPYLIPHTREMLDHSVKDDAGIWQPNPNPRLPSPKLKMRRRLARYENLAATIVDQIAGALFLQAPVRTFKVENPKIAAWFDDCDGKGTNLTAFMQAAWTSAAVFGHTPLFMEKPEAESETAADQGLPYLCAYTPLDVIDWLDDGEGRLTSVKFVEMAPRQSFTELVLSMTNQRVRVVDDKGWRLYAHDGTLLLSGDHGFGELPVEYLYARRRLFTPFVGKPIIGDPQLYIDLYNLTSEERELLRNQTFAILNVPIGKDGDVNQEQAKIGVQSGTSNVLFSTNPAAFVQPDAMNVGAYSQHRTELTRLIYRQASVPWEGDSKDMESAESRRIKRSEQEQVLKSFALECQRVERELVRLAYVAIVGAEQAQAQMEKDGLTITYPSTFQPLDLTAALTNAAAAIGMDLGETAQKEVKKRTVRAMLPDAGKDVITVIDKELESQEYVSAEDKRQEEIGAASQRFAS